MKRKKQNSGFTLLELMIVIAILGVLAAMAAPSFRSMIERQKVRSALNEWQSSFYFAQKEALRLKESVILCGSTDGTTCRAEGNVFSNGWIVVTAGNRVLEDNNFNDPSVDIRINGNNFVNGVTFFNNGRTNTGVGVATLTVSINNAADDVQMRTLSISGGGRLVGVKR